MECPSIRNFTLDQDDVNALKAIRKIQRNSALLAIALPSGVMTSLFLKSNTIGAAYNINSTDWRGFAKAMDALTVLEKKQIEKTAKIRAMAPDMSHLQRQFWKAVGRGCEVPSR